MLKFTIGIFGFIIILFLFSIKPVYAYQNFNVCYSQGAAYHFFWKGDMCWDLIQEHCSQGALSGAKGLISYLKNIYDLAKKGASLKVDVLTILKAMLICKPTIDNCIVPKLQTMKSQCQADMYYYAPNLTAMNTWYNRDAPGLFYDDDNHTLTIQVLNNGSAYAWDIGVNVSYGTTDDRKKLVSGGGFLMENEIIPELTFFGANRTGYSTMMGSLKNFLINESNVSSYLSSFKDDHNIRPFYWEKTIPFTAPPNKLTKINLMIDPNQNISEQSEKDNLFSLIIDNLPTPSRFKIENLKVERVDNLLTKYKVSFDINNTGEESGQAIIKWIEGNNVGSLTETGKTVAGKGTVHVERTFDINVKDSGNSCLKHKDYHVEVRDADGLHDQADFEIPAFAGEIYGRVLDLFGKPVVGATVKTDTGATTTTQNAGFYHLKGIDKLGKIMVTASSEKFTQSESKEVELKFLTEDFLHTCSVEGLTLTYVPFVLKNKPVQWKIILKDSAGQLINGHVVAYNDLFRHQTAVNGETTIKDVQPGEYQVTASAQGYYSQFLKININPPEETTEIILEKIYGRENDDGLYLITPKLLWQKQLGSGGGKIGELASTKDGKLLVVAVANNKTKVSSLFFINPLTGKNIKTVSVPFMSAEQRNIGLNASYDGRTVGFFINPGAPGKTDKERILKLFNASGSEIGSTTMSRRSSIFLDTSPDGFYLYTGSLVNSSLHKYTRKEIEGVGDGRDLQGYGSFVYFLKNGNLISGCKEKIQGECERTISDQMVRKIGEVKGGPELIDSTYDDKTIIIRADRKLYRFGSSSWEKESRRDAGFVSAAISPGGMYTLVAEGNGSNKWLRLKVFGNTGGDKTPAFDYKDVRFVDANDKGLFFAEVVSDKISYYQIGAYKKDYNAPKSTVTSTKGSNFVTDFFMTIINFVKKVFGLTSTKKP